jgi:hypothetical protein
MRLVLVHGRGQGEKSAEQLRTQWLDALAKGLRDARTPGLPTDLDVRVPFYGALLDRLTFGDSVEGVVSRGAVPGSADPIEGVLVLKLAKAAGVTDEEIAAEAHTRPTAVQRGPENWEWVQAAAVVLERKVPWFGERLLRALTRDVHAYLSRVDVTTQVNAILAAELDEGPAVVVGHSLGSIVAYWVLTEQGRQGPHVKVPLFVTVGSPLGIDVIQQYLPNPRGMPGGVAAWLNAADERDPVALVSRLDRDTFAPDTGIENVTDLHNPRENPHGIVGYLSDNIVARRIGSALRS